MGSTAKACPISRHILIAVDESDNAERAVWYVSYMMAGVKGIKTTLINVVAVPPEDFFVNDQERRSWLEQNEAKAKKVLDVYKDILVNSGFAKDDITALMKVGEYPSVAKVIFDEALQIGAGTIVIGRRGISKKEEFIFGSISNKILHSQKNCVALWVVE